MGYNSYVTGGFKVTPALSDTVIANQLSMDEDGSSELVCVSGGSPDDVGLVNGQITVIPGNSWTEVKCRYEEPYKAYELDGTVAHLVQIVKQQGCTIEGSLYVDGEESPDFSRYRMENNRAIHETPEFLWPNGDKGWSK